MPLTLEDHERRITALEVAQSAGSGNAIVRVEQKLEAILPAIAGMIAESEKRTEMRIATSEDRLREQIGTTLDASEQRMRADMRAEMSAAEQRFVDLLNERFDAVMVAIDRLENPPV